MRCVVIIPAYNEEKTVGDVVAAALACPTIAEVVVVSDGSRDQTARVAAEAGATVIDLQENRGKGGAMKAGLEAVEGDVFLFLDADLIGLTPRHVSLLLDPIVTGSFEVTLGVFGQGRMMTDLAQKIAPFLSGQRALTKRVLSDIPDFAGSGFGVEAVVTRYLQTTKIPVAVVALADLTHVMKEEKRGFFSGISSRLLMYWQIARVLAGGRRIKL